MSDSDAETQTGHAERLARMAETDDRARVLAVELTGLPIAAARERVGEHPGLVLRELQRDQVLTMEFRSGRINVIVEDGVVVEATIG